MAEVEPCPQDSPARDHTGTAQKTCRPAHAP
jgi:hypothetical protein